MPVPGHTDPTLFWNRLPLTQTRVRVGTWSSAACGSWPPPGRPTWLGAAEAGTTTLTGFSRSIVRSLRCVWIQRRPHAAMSCRGQFQPCRLRIW